MEHSKRNSASDDAVTVALKDADRLANAGAGVLIRAGQFRPKDPVIDLEYAFKPDPTATFREPKTQLRNLQHILEWEDWLRLPKAKEIGKRRFAFIRMSIEQLFDDLREAELLPAKISGGFYTEDFKRDQEFDPRN